MNQLPFYKKITFKLVIVLLVVILSAISISYYFTVKYTTQLIYKNINKEFTTAVNVTNNFIEVLAQTSQLWAKHVALDNDLGIKIINNELEEIDALIKIDKEVVSADTIIVVDKNAIVLSQQGTSYKKGDNLKRTTIMNQTLTKQRSISMILRERESFILYTSSPIWNQKEMVGATLIGYFINDVFLENIKNNVQLDMAFVGNSAIMSSTNWGEEKNLDILPMPYVHYQKLLKDNTIKEIEYKNKHFLVKAKHLDKLDSNLSGSILLAFPSEVLYKERQEVIQNLGLFFILLSIVGLIVILVISKKATNAIHQLKLSTNKVAEGNLEEKVHLKTNDEFEVLANNFNLMLDNIKVKDELIKEHTNSLEEKVELRTKELVCVNQKLEDKNSELALLNKNFEELINSTIEAILVLENGKIIDVNESALKLFSFNQKEEMFDSSMDDYIVRKSMDIIKDEENDEQTEMYEATLVDYKGKEFYALLKEGDLVFSHKTIRLISIIDLTELKEKEKLIIQQSKMSSMGEMIENIAHQWRQPLSVITSAASSVKVYNDFDKLTDEKLFGAIDNIIHTSKHLSSTIDDFRLFFKTDKKKVYFNVSESIHANLELLNANLKQSSIHVLLELDDTLGIYGYKNEFIHAIMNIINNAKDVMQEMDEKEQRLLFISLSTDKESVKLSIKDSGGGINKDCLLKVFEPYFTTKHQAQGTGIGLYMTHEIIVGHFNGKINVQNVKYIHKDKKYLGAQFDIILPLSS